MHMSVGYLIAGACLFVFSNDHFPVWQSVPLDFILSLHDTSLDIYLVCFLENLYGLT